MLFNMATTHTNVDCFSSHYVSASYSAGCSPCNIDVSDHDDNNCVVDNNLRSVRGSNLTLITFNLHGFNQGSDAILECIEAIAPDCLLLQEHWLTADNLSKLDTFNDYFVIASPAMCNSLDNGPVFGRPYGGVAVLMKKSLIDCCRVVSLTERFIAILLCDVLVFNVYLPCVGTPNRLALYQDIIYDIWFIRESHELKKCLLVGDFNVDIHRRLGDETSAFLAQFLSEHSLTSSFGLFPDKRFVTYINESLGHQSCIDYFFSDSNDLLVDTFIFEPEVNFSDHLPVVGVIDSDYPVSPLVISPSVDSSDKTIIKIESFLRWDHANLDAYYDCTRVFLEPVLAHVSLVNDAVISLPSTDISDHIDNVITMTSNALTQAGRLCVPAIKKNLFKYWWNDELRRLKQESIETNRDWKNAGKPRFGATFLRRQKARLNYRKKIRENQLLEKNRYSNTLHDNLINKKTVAFWKAWKSNFGRTNTSVAVDGTYDKQVIVNNFAKYFHSLTDPAVNEQERKLESEYHALRLMYSGDYFVPPTVDAELVGSCLSYFERGKSSGPDNVSAEHLMFCHPIVVSILSKVFNWILMSSCVPDSFCVSYTVPISKSSNSFSRVATCNDFRGIAVSNCISKLFEACILEIYGHYLFTDDSQFGFKPGLGCSQAIFVVNRLVKLYIDGGDTVNLAALDIAKAFPRVNHFALFIKLMKRNVPISLLDLLVNWFSRSSSCVRWCTMFSDCFNLRTGLNQGSVLAPALFAVCIDDVIKKCNASGLGTIVVYADDIILITRSCSNLQKLLDIVQNELVYLNLSLNAEKCCCLRIGPRFNAFCAQMTCLDGTAITWVSQIRYLGIFIVSGRSFRCSIDEAKRKFNRAANSIFGKLFGSASEELILHLLKVKCMPILLYGSEACDLNKTMVQSLDFSVVRFGMKLFRTSNCQFVLNCFRYFTFDLPNVAIPERRKRFLFKFANVENALCRYVAAFVR